MSKRTPDITADLLRAAYRQTQREILALSTDHAVRWKRMAELLNAHLKEKEEERMSEHTTMFLHFSPEEDLPRIGDTIEATSPLTNTTYRATILAVMETKTLSDGRIQMKVRADREAIS